MRTRMLFLGGGDMAAFAGQCETFNSNTKIAVEKELRVRTTAPGVIIAEEAVITTENGIVLGYFGISTSALGSSERIGAPKADVHFPISIPFRARRWSGSYLLH